MSSNVARPAALEFAVQELGGPTLEQESFPAATTTSGVAVQGNGDRVGLLIMNLGANNINVGLAGTITNTGGILLAANGGFISMNVRDDFTLPTRQWDMLAAAGTSAVYVLEIIRYRRQPLEGF